MARGGDRRIRMGFQQSRHVPHQRRIQQRFVALHVHHDLVIREPQRHGRLGQPIGPRRVIGARHAGKQSLRGNGIVDARVVGRNHDARRAARKRALRDPHDHRLAGDVGERLAGQPR